MNSSRLPEVPLSEFLPLPIFELLLSEPDLPLPELPLIGSRSLPDDPCISSSCLEPLLEPLLRLRSVIAASSVCEVDFNVLTTLNRAQRTCHPHPIETSPFCDKPDA